jgi:hypothetical protein
MLQTKQYFFPQNTCTHCGQLINNKKALIINTKRKLSTLGGKLIFFYLVGSPYFRSIVFETSLLSVFDSILRSKAMSKQLQTKKLGFNNF